MYDYIIGIDGGGTKTLGVLYDFDGSELKRVQLGFSNFSVNEETSKQNIIEIIRQLLSGVEQQKKVYIQMGVAGASRLSNPDVFLKEIETQFDCKANLVIDAMISMYSVKKEQDESLIMAIGGTGSVLMIEHNGEVNRLGGWGHLLGDGGSAYHLVLEAFKNLIEEYEKDLPYSPLSNHLIKVIGADSPQKILEYVYNKDKSTLAKLSLEIQAMANEDKKVEELLVNEGNLLAEQIILAYNKYIKEGPVVVALRGSFSIHALYVKETIVETVNSKIKEVKFDIDGHEPVYGAYVLAKKNILKGV